MTWFSLSDYMKKHGPRTYPSDYKRCMQCGQVVPWEGDCEYQHFEQIGKDIRRKASDIWGPKKGVGK